MGCDLAAYQYDQTQGSFNPRTHMGCDPTGDKLTAPYTGFNPRTHMGCDHAEVASDFLDRVSIHAPTWGATVGTQLFGCAEGVSIHAPRWGATFFAANTPSKAEFQSTHPHGVRLPIPLSINIYLLFQSTHPHGVRHWGWCLQSLWSSFNPRTHMGCDYKIHHREAILVVSIHAPTWGATVLSG